MRVRAVTASDAGLLASAVALRWSRPDLTAALAEHVGEAWAGDDRTWVAAAGWQVHGRAAIGDGRQCASDALAEIARRGAGLLDDPAADRLRIEIATLAAGQCEPAVARLLVAPVLGADRPADIRADALAVLARCVMEERPAAIGEATRRAEVAWAEIGGQDADIAGAALALLSAAAVRRSGHPELAVDRAAEGLARLDDIGAAQDGTPSRHLAAALAAEWITALIEAGRTDDAREGSAPMVQQLRETARPTRQIALLRLAVARAIAESTAAAAVALEQAAQDAAACDTPDLEGLCLSTLGALREQSGRLDAALESMRRGVAAQRRDRARSERFREALRAMSLGSPAARAEAAAAPLDRIGRAQANLARRHVRSTAIGAKDNLVEPVHPLAGADAVGPWSSGRWTERPTAATGRGGRRRRASRAGAWPEDIAAKNTGAAVDAEEGYGRADPGSASLSPADVGVLAGAAEGDVTVPGSRGADEAHPDAGGGHGVSVAVEADSSTGGRHGAAAGGSAIEAVLGGAQARVGHRGGVGVGRHAGGSGDTAAPSTAVDAPGRAAGSAPVASRDVEYPVVPATDPLFGPLEHLAAAGPDDIVVHTGSEKTDVEGVANPADCADLLQGSLPRTGGIEDIPIAHEERPARTAYEGERWLEAALAELDRVWGQPLPDLHGPVGPRAAPTAAAPVVSGRARGGPGENGQAEVGGAVTGSADRAVDGRAEDGRAEDGRAEDGRAEDGRAEDGRAEDGRAEDGRAEDGRAEDGRAGDDPAARQAMNPDVDEHSGGDRHSGDDPIGLSRADGPLATDVPVAVGGRAAVGPDAVGCVVVVDVVRGGTPVSDASELLRDVGDRLSQRMPAGARLRCEADESAQSVVLPGRERSAATEWMHQTLPAVFADVADLAVPSRWATGTTLRAAVHGTDGPVGAQLLQRLDLVAPRSPVPPARHNVPPTAVVRWGVPILVGSGGRRRRPDDVLGTQWPGAEGSAADQSSGVDQKAGNDEPDAVARATVGGGGPEIEEGRRGPRRSYWDCGGDRRPLVELPDGGASDTPGRHREAVRGPRDARADGERAEDEQAGSGRADGGPAEGERAEDGRAGSGRAEDKRAEGERAEDGWAGSDRAEGDRAEGDPWEGDPSEGDRAEGAPATGELTTGEPTKGARTADERAGSTRAGAGAVAADATELAGRSAEPVSAERRADAVAADESAFSVEGLGLADLLAGALAAYRGI